MITSVSLKWAEASSKASSASSSMLNGTCLARGRFSSIAASESSEREGVSSCRRSPASVDPLLRQVVDDLARDASEQRTIRTAQKVEYDTPLSRSLAAGPGPSTG